MRNKFEKGVINFEDDIYALGIQAEMQIWFQHKYHHNHTNSWKHQFFEEPVDCALLSSFCDDSNLHISVFKQVLFTMGVSKELILKFLIGKRFHIKLRILGPEISKQSLRVKSWKA